MSLIKINQKIAIPLYYTEKVLSSGFVKHKIIQEAQKAKIQAEVQQLKQKFLLQHSNDAVVPQFQVPANKIVKVVNTTWKIFNWKQAQQITQLSIGADKEWDFVKYRDIKIKRGLIGWDVLDDNNNPVPCTPMYMQVMPTPIMLALYDKYDKITTRDDEDEKK